LNINVHNLASIETNNLQVWRVFPK